MSLKRSLNHPMWRELKQIGLVEDDGTTAKLSGPFKIKAEIIQGVGEGLTMTTSETPLDGGLIGLLAFDFDHNDSTTLIEDTNFSIDDDTITAITDLQGHDILAIYSY